MYIMSGSNEERRPPSVYNTLASRKEWPPWQKMPSPQNIQHRVELKGWDGGYRVVGKQKVHKMGRSEVTKADQPGVKCQDKREGETRENIINWKDLGFVRGMLLIDSDKSS